jgi:hypothetical protein
MLGPVFGDLKHFAGDYGNFSARVKRISGVGGYHIYHGKVEMWR